MSKKINLEKKTIESMLAMYCKDKHHTQVLCPECSETLDYALERLSRCQFGEKKPVCGNCTVHCYRKEKREKMIDIMRYAGPRMILTHPVLAVNHLLQSLKKNHKA